MNYISSDANVWIDFCVINALDIPFRMEETSYIMYAESIEELKTPETLKADLLSLGLQLVDMTDEELLFAAAYGDPRLSAQDIIALAIAKMRCIPLLTGDKRLRDCAQKEGVEVFGTLGLLDRLYESRAIDALEYRHCLELLHAESGRRRLPEKEIMIRIERLSAGN